MLTNHGESNFRQYRCALFLGMTIAAASTLGCDDWEWTGSGWRFTDRCEDEPFAVRGTWQLSGEGSRSSCSVERRNGDITFSSGGRWSVQQNFNDGPGCSSLTVNTPGDTGGVEMAETRGSLVTFNTWEVIEYDDGTEATVDLQWRGERSADRRFSGTVRGTSTDGCRFNGSFSATVSPE